MRAPLLALERLHRVVRADRVNGNAHEGLSFANLRHAEDLKADYRPIGNVRIRRRQCISAAKTKKGRR